MVRQATCMLAKLEESISVYLWGKPMWHPSIHSNTKDETCGSNFISQDFSTIQNELQLLNVKETFLTDSEVVLGYI